MIKGIDTSSNNGVITDSIAQQVDFMIIRVGYGNDEKNQDDKQFENTLNVCLRNNKLWGVYIYSYALSVAEAISEANHVKRMLNGRIPPLGIWFDMEDADGYKKKHGFPSKETIVQITKTFCDMTGAGIYASLSWFNNLLNDTRLDNYPKWVAQWNNKCTYTKPYHMWQYTNSLMIDGKRFDGNELYNITIQPNTPTLSRISYQSHDMRKKCWLPEVSNREDYAGNMGNIMDALYVRADVGNIYYRVHTRQNGWLPEVKNRDDYAGNYNQGIDAVAIRSDTGKQINYRVHILGGRWLPPVTGYNTNEPVNGYAGVLGKIIDAVEIWV